MDLSIKETPLNRPTLYIIDKSIISRDVFSMKPLPQMMPVPALENLEKEMSDLLSNITDIRKEGMEGLIYIDTNGLNILCFTR